LWNSSLIGHIGGKSPAITRFHRPRVLFVTSTWHTVTGTHLASKASRALIFGVRVAALSMTMMSATRRAARETAT
jgi:hypothetical protein